MGDSSPDGTATNRLRAAFVASLVALSASSVPLGLAAQVDVEPTLSGRALLGDSTLTQGMVVLHHLTNTTQGEIDSVAIAADGSFSFRLPTVPDPELGDGFFASVDRHDVTYFGGFLTTLSQLDSVYRIQTYDTVLAPEQGVELQMEIRTLFFEAVDGRWLVTDVFQLGNTRTRTIVTRETGAVWRYPLPPGAYEFAVSEGDVAPDVIDLEEGDLVLRASVAPGSRMFVVRYALDELSTAIPTPGVVDQFELLIREPSPPMDVEGLSFLTRVELEAGSTYRRYSGQSVDLPAIQLVALELPTQPPVEWVAVVLALLLTGMALFALRGSDLSLAREAPQLPATDRHSLLVQVARLDDEFEVQTAPDAAVRALYERRRAELLRHIRGAP